MSQGDTVLNAAIGAAVSIVLSFTMFSPILGGAVAAYLQGGDRRTGIRVGAISGAIAAVPFLLFILVVLPIMLSGAMMGGGMAFPGSIFLFAVVALVFALAWTVGLSAAGGYLGNYIVSEYDVGGRSAN